MSGKPVIHLVNLHLGYGDVLCCLWTVAALKEQGREVRFYTPKHEFAALWHEESYPESEAPEEAVVIFGRRNEDRLVGDGGNRLDLIRSRVPEEARPGGVRQPSVRRELLPMLAQPPAIAASWGPEVMANWHRVVLLFPFSEWAQRAWPLSHWLLLAARAEEAGLLPIALGYAADRVAMAGFPRHMWGLDLLQVMALMQRAGAVVSNDSAPLHLAAALSRPVLAVHSIQRPDAILDHYPTAVSLYPEGDRTCAGCTYQPSLRYHPAHCRTTCAELATISPNRVLEALYGVPGLRGCLSGV